MLGRRATSMLRLCELAAGMAARAGAERLADETIALLPKERVARACPATRRAWWVWFPRRCSKLRVRQGLLVVEGDGVAEVAFWTHDEDFRKACDRLRGGRVQQWSPDLPWGARGATTLPCHVPARSCCMDLFLRLGMTLALARCPGLVLTGFGAAGAVAQVFAVHYAGAMTAFDLRPNCCAREVFSFGAPRVSDRRMGAVLARLGVDHHRFVLQGDGRVAGPPGLAKLCHAHPCLLLVPPACLPRLPHPWFWLTHKDPEHPEHATNQPPPPPRTANQWLVNAARFVQTQVLKLTKPPPPQLYAGEAHKSLGEYLGCAHACDVHTAFRPRSKSW